MALVFEITEGFLFLFFNIQMFAEVDFWCFFETGCHSLVQADLELTAILLPQPPGSWDYKWEPH